MIFFETLADEEVADQRSATGSRHGGAAYRQVSMIGADSGAAEPKTCCADSSFDPGENTLESVNHA